MTKHIHRHKKIHQKKKKTKSPVKHTGPTYAGSLTFTVSDSAGSSTVYGNTYTDVHAVAYTVCNWWKGWAYQRAGGFDQTAENFSTIPEQSSGRYYTVSTTITGNLRQYLQKFVSTELLLDSVYAELMEATLRHPDRFTYQVLSDTAANITIEFTLH